MRQIPCNLSIVKKLISLVKGDAIVSSQLKGSWVQGLVDDEVLIQIKHGAGYVYKASDTEGLRIYLANKQTEFSNLEELQDRLSQEEPFERNEQVKFAGDSKLKQSKPAYGFFINSYEPIETKINGEQFVLSPIRGACTYITDIEHFSIPEDVVVVGVENMESINLIHRQKSLFDLYIPNSRLVFVSRYPCPSAAKNWITKISNRYVHFGDFDLAGIQIYLGYYNLIEERASMLIPNNIEEYLISQSARKDLYLTQEPSTKKMVVTDSRVQFLVNLIHKYQRGFEQEGLID